MGWNGNVAELEESGMHYGRLIQCVLMWRVALLINSTDEKHDSKANKKSACKMTAVSLPV